MADNRQFDFSDAVNPLTDDQLRQLSASDNDPGPRQSSQSGHDFSNAVNPLTDDQIRQLSASGIPGTGGRTPADQDESFIDQAVDFATNRPGLVLGEMVTRPFRRGVEDSQEAAQALGGGTQDTGSALGSTYDAWTGDAEGIERAAERSQQREGTEAQQSFKQALQSRVQPDDGFIGNTINVLGAAATEPEGALHEMIAQLPNTGVAMGGMITGGKLGGAMGTAAGPAGTAIGTIAGGLTGLFLGTSAVETGFLAQEAAQDGELTDQDLADVRRQGATKGAVITGVDAATLGLSRYLAGVPGRTVERAVTRELADRGVDVADDAAVLNALQSPEVVNNVARAGSQALTDVMGRGSRLSRGGASFAGQTAGEGTGEYLGTMAAGLEASSLDAVLESFMAMPQSAFEMQVAQDLTSPGQRTRQAQDAGADIGIINRARAREDVIAGQGFEPGTGDLDTSDATPGDVLASTDVDSAIDAFNSNMDFTLAPEETPLGAEESATGQQMAGGQPVSAEQAVNAYWDFNDRFGDESFDVESEQGQQLQRIQQQLVAAGIDPQSVPERGQVVDFDPGQDYTELDLQSVPMEQGTGGLPGSQIPAADWAIEGIGRFDEQTQTWEMPAGAVEGETDAQSQQIRDRLQDQIDQIKASGPTDELAAYIAKNGGINRDEAQAQGVMDINQRAPGTMRWIFTRQGRSFDQWAEKLQEEGFLQEGEATANEVVRRLRESVNGQAEHYAPAGQEVRALVDLQQEQEAAQQQFEDGDWTLEPLEPVHDPAVLDEMEGSAELDQQSRFVAGLVADAQQAGVPDTEIQRILAETDIFEPTGFTGVAEIIDATERSRQATTDREDAAGRQLATPEGQQAPAERPAFEGAQGRAAAPTQEQDQSRPDVIVRANGEPFSSERVARASRQYRDTPDAQIVPVEGGFGVQSSPTEIDLQANQAATSPANDLAEPTDSQIEAGNYKKGHLNIQGLDISVENPRGSTRSGTDPDGNEWSVEMQNHYGYVRGTEGADAEQVDVFVGDNPDSDRVFVVDQIDQDGNFDEQKAMIGFDSEQEAVDGYKANYEDGWQVGPVTAMSMDEFKRWLQEGDTSAPLDESVNVAEPQQAIEGAIDPDDQPTSLDTIQSNWRERGIDVSASERDNVIDLNVMTVPQEQRGRGVGTDAMQELTEYADRTGQTIALTPSTDFGASSVNRLKRFYKRFGFVENKGRNRDFEISESMYRRPGDTPSQSTAPDTEATPEAGGEQAQQTTPSLDEEGADILDAVRQLGTANVEVRDVLDETGLRELPEPVREQLQAAQQQGLVTIDWRDERPATQSARDASTLMGGEGNRIPTVSLTAEGEAFLQQPRDTAAPGGEDARQTPEPAPAEPEAATTEPTVESVRQAWQQAAQNYPYPDVPISEVYERHGGDLGAFQNALRQAMRDGQAVASVGDWSLSSDAERDAAIAINDRPHLTVRFTAQQEEAPADTDEEPGRPSPNFSRTTYAEGEPVRWLFAGRGSQSADRYQLGKARRLVQEGMDPETVRQQTGWFQGPERGWRYEISDDAASVRVDGNFGEAFETVSMDTDTVTVGDMLDHSELYAAYPQLADIQLQRLPDGSRSRAMVRLRRDKPPVVHLRADLPSGEWRSSLLHELQHGIQNIEGFARGASIEALETDRRSAEQLIQNVNEALRSHARLMDIARQQRDTAMVNDLQAEYDQLLAYRNDDLVPRSQADPVATYRRVAGEVEARNVQTRRNMTAEQRQEIPPRETLDVPASEVAVAFNGNVAADAPTPANATDAASETLGREQVQRVMDGMTTQMPGAPEVIVVQNLQDSRVPEEVRTEDARQRSQGAEGEPEGFYYRDRAYLVLDGITRQGGERDMDAVFRVFSHEVLGHAGLRSLFGRSLDSVLEEVIDQRRSDVERKAAEYGLDMADSNDAMVAAEELLAEMAQTEPSNGLVTRAIEAIRRALRALYARLPREIKDAIGNTSFVRWLNNLTDAEITERFIVPARQYIEQGRSDDSMTMEPVFQRSEQTEQDYETRIDELYAGDSANQIGVQVLDSSDVLGMLGYQDFPVRVAEGKIVAGRHNHQLTAEHWKNIPKWLDDPVAVFESATVDGRLVAIAPETLDGDPIVMILQPDAEMGSMDVHLLVNAYERGSLTPIRRWVDEGKYLYGDDKKIPAFNRASGLRLPRVSDIQQGYGHKVYARRDLVKQRNQATFSRESADGEARSGTDSAPLQSRREGDRGAQSDTIPTNEDVVDEGRTTARRSSEAPGSYSRGDRIAEARREAGLRDDEGDAGQGPAGRPRFSRAGQDASPNVDPAADAEAAGPSFGIPEDTLTSLTIRKMQDKFQPLKDLQTSIQEAGGTIDEASDAYRAEELFHGKAENDLRLFQEQYVQPLAKKMADFGIRQEDIDRYLYAKHAPERNAQIASINPDIPDGGSGMTDAEAAQIIQEVRQSGQHDQYEQIAKIVYDMLGASRRVIRNAGLEEEGLIDAWESQYEHYVPLKGWAEDTKAEGVPGRGQGYSIGGRESRRAMGRTSEAASPLSYAIGDVTKTLLRKRKNEVGNAFLSLVENNPNPDFWQVFTEDNPDTERRVVKERNEQDELVDQVREMPVPMAMVKDRYFTTKRDGKTYYIKLQDDRLMTAMKNLGPESNGAVIRTLAGVNRLLSSLNTSYSPEFVVSNFSRDVQTAILNLQAEQSLEQGKAAGQRITEQTLKDIPIAMKAIHSSMRQKQASNDREAQWQKYFEQFRADGAKTGWFDQKDLDGQAREISNLVAMERGDFKGELIKVRKTLTDAVENINHAVENAVRLSAYINARRGGISRQQSASLAKNMTVNFNRRGEAGTTLNALYMFANASIQGVANFTRTMGTFKGDGRVRWENLNNAQRLAVGITAGAYFMAMANRLGAGDDDDGENWYDKVPDYVKERNLVIMKSLLGGEQDGSYWEIPLPYGYNVFYVLGSGMESVFNGGQSAGEAGSQLALATLGSFSPIGFQESETVQGLLLKNAAPTVIKPAAELGLNENFMGLSIYSENLPFGVPQPKSAMGRRSTPEPYKAVAQWLNRVTGGSDYRSGEIDVQPEIMQYIINYFGGSAYGFWGDKLPDTAYRAMTGVDIETHRVPFYSRISGRVMHYDDMDRFYERRDEIGQIEEEAKALPPRRRASFVSRFRDRLNMRGIADQTEERLRILRRRRDHIYNQDLSPGVMDERLEEVEERMKGVVDRFNLRYNNLTDQ